MSFGAGVRLTGMNAHERRYRQSEAEDLARVGAVLSRAELPLIEVRNPEGPAERAVAAWNRDDDASTSGESPAEREARHRAGTFALIGLAIDERGRWEDDAVLVALSPVLVGLAVDAA